MPDWLTLLIMGGFFLILGIALFTWGKRTENSYYDSLASSTDVRKFVERLPRPRYVSLKIGGRVAVAIGLVIITMGGAFWLWG
jgi:hypothetical protein